MGERIKKSAKASNSTFTSEEKRAREVLYDLEKRISQAWQIQSRGKLTQEALQVISDDLNKLAQEKKSLKDYLDGLTEMRVDQEDVEARSELLFERLEEFEKGWAKAPQSLQKILLKRVIRNVVTQADGIKILYRLRDGIDEKRNQGLALGNHQKNGNVIEPASGFREKGSLGNSRDLKVLGSLKVRNGRGDRIRTCDPLVPNQMRYQTALLPDRGTENR